MTLSSTSASTRTLRAAGLAAALALGASFAFAQAPAPPPSDDGPDPALVNLAPSDQTTPDQNQQPAATPAANPQDYLQQSPAPIVRQAPGATPTTPDADNAPATDNQPAAADPQADAQITAGEAALEDADADQPPPPLPDYDQPPAPADDYLWTPGYWAYAPVGYYWVPGAWVYPPFYGALWTPPYWGWFNGRYRFHPGYWGTHIGFYGGVNYGFGYIGIGYFGGYWSGNRFFYNRAVTAVGPAVTNVYVHTVVYNNHVYGPRPASTVSYNGGRGGIAVAPRPAELAAMRETHTAPLPGQLRLHQAAAQNPQAAFYANGGRPAVAARANPLGANRTIAPSQSEFQVRPSAALQQARPAAQEPRFQPQQRSQPQQQSRPAPQFHPAPASHPAPPPAHEAKH